MVEVALMIGPPHIDLPLLAEVLQGFVLFVFLPLFYGKTKEKNHTVAFFF